eukprot:COSAG01_NODE_3721_length_5764_cov_2.689673_4_plen_52_part_00
MRWHGVPLRVIDQLRVVVGAAGVAAADARVRVAAVHVRVGLPRPRPSLPGR